MYRMAGLGDDPTAVDLTASTAADASSSDWIIFIIGAWIVYEFVIPLFGKGVMKGSNAYRKSKGKDPWFKD